MKIARCTLSQKHWYCYTRKPIICPHCKKREEKTSMFGMPTQEAFKVENGILLAVSLISQGIDTGVAITLMQLALKRLNL